MPAPDPLGTVHRHRFGTDFRPQRNCVLEIATITMLFVVALMLRLAAIWIWHFDGLYGQDAFAYYKQGVAIARGLPEGILPPEDFFWPSGYPLLAAVAIWLLGRTESAAQLVNVLYGAALASLAYALSRSLLPGIGRCAGIVAGLTVAVAGQSLLSSIVIMADIPALCWAALAAWLLAQASPVGATINGQPTPGFGRRRLHHGVLLLAGLALGLAVVTRWIYALLALPFAAYVLYRIWPSRATLPSLLLLALGAFSLLLPQVWLSLARPESLLHSWLLNWRLGNAFERQFSHIDGDYTYMLPVGLYYLQPIVHPNYMVPVLGLAALWGIWTLWRARAWGPLILLGGWLGVVYLFLAGIPYENFRFGLTLYLPAVLLAGVGVEALRTEPPSVVRRRLNTGPERKIWERGVYVVAALCLFGMGGWAVHSTGRFLYEQKQSKAIARQVDSILPEDATVLAFGLTLTLQHYTGLDVVEFYNLDEETLAAATTTPAPVYLLLDLGNVAQHWQGRPPALNYGLLRTHRTLTQVADFPPYTLFLVSQRAREKKDVKELRETGPDDRSPSFLQFPSLPEDSTAT